MSTESPPSPLSSTITGEASRREIWHRLLPTVLYAVAIFYFATSRISVLPPTGLLSSDKVLHAAVFGGFAVLLYRGSCTFWKLPKPFHHVVVAVLLSSLVGALVEVVQSFLSYRSAELLDFVADTLGSVVFATVASWLRVERNLIWKL